MGETLYSLGFSFPYSEIQKFESYAAISQGKDIPVDHGNSAAAIEQGTDTPDEKRNSFIQYVADNVDHNLRNIDGHSMEWLILLLQHLVPKERPQYQELQFPWKTWSLQLPSISISTNTEKSPNLTYKELLDIRIDDWKGQSSRLG